jgi:hypothetical protein
VCHSTALSYLNTNLVQHVPIKTTSWPPSSHQPNAKRLIPPANTFKPLAGRTASTTSLPPHSSTSLLRPAMHHSPLSPQPPATRPQPAHYPLKLNGQPFGLTLASRPHTEHTLLHFLTAYENIFPPRALPLPLSSVPLQDANPEPLPDQPIIDLILHEWDTRRFSCSADALADWLNARWRKSGYELSAETICEVLRSNGRIAFRGLGDDAENAFSR